MKRKKPKFGDLYWHVRVVWGRTEVSYGIWENNKIDRGQWSMYNVFSTRKDAKKAEKQIRKIFRS